MAIKKIEVLPYEHTCDGCGHVVKSAEETKLQGWHILEIPPWSVYVCANCAGKVKKKLVGWIRSTTMDGENTADG